MEEEVRAFAHHLLVGLPAERAENRTAARLIDLWNARRARGAEPLFAPTIGAAIRAGRPWLRFYCPGCQVVGEIDLRRVDGHRGTSVESAIPQFSHAVPTAAAVREADRPSVPPVDLMQWRKACHERHRNARG